MVTTNVVTSDELDDDEDGMLVPGRELVDDITAPAVPVFNWEELEPAGE